MREHHDRNGGGRLTITDTGIGIRAEDLPRVCEKAIPDITVMPTRNRPESGCIFAAQF